MKLLREHKLVLAVLITTIGLLIFGVLKYGWYFKEISALFMGMGLVVGFINFVIPSSTGQAVVVMPIMSSLSDITGVTRQIAVLAFEAGDGYWNMITPTHPVVMASIGLAGISFPKWFKYASGLVLKWTIWILAILAIAATINWGPF